MSSGLVAIVVGFLVAIAAFVPFVAVSYRRRGEMTLGRSLMWLAAVVYAMALWTYTLLPLPNPADMVCAGIQTTPGQFVSDILDEGIGGPSALLHNRAFLQVALNVMLFMPLGWFIRHLGGHGVVVATLTGLVASALIETTQVTGIWGMYECAYRVFDVDDLIMNTAGALLGSLVGMLFWNRSKRGPDAARPRPITAVRRFLGILCDLALSWMVTSGVMIITVGIALLDGRDEMLIPATILQVAAVVLPVVIQLISVLAGGVTLGERVVLLRSVPGRMPAALARPLRFLFGIGGFLLLQMWDEPVAGLAMFVLVVVTFIMVFTTRQHRGLACVVSDLQLDDRREQKPSGQRTVSA